MSLKPSALSAFFADALRRRVIGGRRRTLKASAQRETHIRSRGYCCRATAGAGAARRVSAPSLRMLWLYVFASPGPRWRPDKAGESGRYSKLFTKFNPKAPSQIKSNFNFKFRSYFARFFRSFGETREKKQIKNKRVSNGLKVTSGTSPRAAGGRPRAAAGAARSLNLISISRPPKAAME
ncbi:hypothetical protein EVAR_18692_1 [Eumeta japonica]|uniref:Uncharacterized protein n=1 Tax=Eumeta variegata TaxID=151549 RepID=A0A4C1U6U6_EUMVA|nr:hypothetical protein EVAR_18692_1 [Eumeta japonica]